MPKHEFGIMDILPDPEWIFDDYEPEKYNCISVNDEFIEPLLMEMAVLDTYSHSTSRPCKGLEYCGITLIPPAALPWFRDIVVSAGLSESQALSEIIGKAIREQKFMIHFGI